MKMENIKMLLKILINTIILISVILISWKII